MPMGNIMVLNLGKHIVKIMPKASIMNADFSVKKIHNIKEIPYLFISKFTRDGPIS